MHTYHLDALRFQAIRSPIQETISPFFMFFGRATEINSDVYTIEAFNIYSITDVGQLPETSDIQNAQNKKSIIEHTYTWKHIRQF